MMTPAFSLNFTSATLDPRITFTRALATATRVNSSGFIEGVAADTPRFDHDPLTLACMGLLVEESRINYVRHSADFPQAAWQKEGSAISVSSNAALAPDNTLSADLFTENSTNSSKSVYQTIVSPPSGTVTNTVHVKANSGTRYLRLCTTSSATDFGYVTVDMSNGVITQPATAVGTATNASATSSLYNNEWYKITLTVTLAAPVLFAFLIPTASGTASVNTSDYGRTAYQGNGSSWYIWGAQLEAGAFATSYIPTTSAAVTRNADVATITGTNFSDFWQASKGGVLVRARPGTVSGTRPWVQFDDGTANEIITLRGNTTNPELYIVDDGVAQAQLDAGTIAANTDYSMSAWWATNDCKARLNTGVAVTDLTATIPTVTQARIGSDGTNYLNGHIAGIGYYDTFSGQIYTRRKNKAVFSLV